MTKHKPQRAPAGLSTRGRRLWRDIAAQTHLSADQHVLLHEAARIADRLDVLDRSLAGEGVTLALEEVGDGVAEVHLVVDRALSESRQQQNVLKQLITSLRLPDEDGKRPQRRAARGAYTPGGAKASSKTSAKSALERARAGA